MAAYFLNICFTQSENTDNSTNSDCRPIRQKLALIHKQDGQQNILRSDELLSFQTSKKAISFNYEANFEK